MWKKENWDCLYQMTRAEFKLRDQGTFLGFVWTLLNPALMFSVIYLTFSKWFDRFTPHFGWHLIIGLVQWHFFATSTSNAVSIFGRKQGLVKNFLFNKLLLPISSVLSVFISFIFEAIIVLIAFGWVRGVSFTGIVIFFLMLFANLLLALGIALILASLHVFYKDVQHIWALILRIGFFVTPVFYPLQVIHATKLMILKLNPLYHVLTISRDALLGPRSSMMIGMNYLFISVGGILIVAGLIYRKAEPWMAESL